MSIQSKNVLRVTLAVIVGLAAWLTWSAVHRAVTADAATSQTASRATSVSGFGQFALLRRSATSNDTMSKREAAYLAPLAARGADLRAARAVGTRNGKAWVVPIAAADEVCLAVPDSVPGYGFTCASTSEAARGELIGLMVDPNADPQERSLLVAVLPDGAEASVTDGADSEPLTASDGVISTVLAGDARSLHVAVPALAESRTFDVTAPTG